MCFIYYKYYYNTFAISVLILYLRSITPTENTHTHIQTKQNPNNKLLHIYAVLLRGKI